VAAWFGALNRGQSFGGIVKANAKLSAMSDATIRLAVTFGLLALFIALEISAPKRASVLNLRRFSNQAALALISSVLARMALGGGLAGIAIVANIHRVGLFNVVQVPFWFAAIISFLVLDFAIWAQHMAMHHVPFLWRLHRVHHGDTAMDVSTALRFHPFEILASLAFKVVMVVALGAPVAAVFIFEMVLGAGALFTHANIALPTWLERPLRWLFVTPALHVIHHSPNPVETNSNFGFSFNIWDRLFGMYRSAPITDDGAIGLENWRAPEDQRLLAMLANPFK
jgi:sterol desaturase/sphingolipid hydroxylase (fatty acid hydroxylase superfamily)